MDDAGLYTLNEAAKATGLSVDALRQRIKRGKVRSFRGNEGRVMLRLDAAEVEALKSTSPAAAAPDRQPTSPLVGQLAGQEATLRALEGQAAALRDALDRERARVDRAEVTVDQQRAELTALQGRLERAEAEAGRSREELARIEAEAATQRQVAEAAAEQAQEGRREAVEALAAARRELDARQAGNPLRRILRSLQAPSFRNK